MKHSITGNDYNTPNDFLQESMQTFRLEKQSYDAETNVSRNWGLYAR